MRQIASRCSPKTQLRTICAAAASNKEIGSLENVESDRSTNLRGRAGLAARARFRCARGAGHERARVPQKIQRLGSDSEDGGGWRKDFCASRLPDRQRDLKAGQPRLPAVLEEFEDGSSRDCRPPQSAAVVYGRTERSARIAKPLQRVAGDGERVLPLRPH